MDKLDAAFQSDGGMEGRRGSEEVLNETEAEGDLHGGLPLVSRSLSDVFTSLCMQ